MCNHVPLLLHIFQETKKKNSEGVSTFHQLIGRELDDVQTLGKELFMYFGDLCLRLGPTYCHTVAWYSPFLHYRLVSSFQKSILEIQVTKTGAPNFRCMKERDCAICVVKTRR